MDQMTEPLPASVAPTMRIWVPNSRSGERRAVLAQADGEAGEVRHGRHRQRRHDRRRAGRRASASA